MTTNEIRWVLLTPDKDGNPLRWLSDADLLKLLADPAPWGVDEFKHLNDAPSTDPNYWPHGLGVLLRVEVVVPVRGGWQVAGVNAPTCAPDSGRWVHSTGSITSGDVIQ